MRMFAVAAGLAGMLACGTAFAQSTASNQQTQACYTQARQQVLSGEALATFMAHCTTDRVAPTPASATMSNRCADQARLLSGEQKAAALRDCR